MIIHEITEECFRKYGKVIDSIDLTELVSTMQTVEIPADVRKPGLLDRIRTMQ